MASEFFLLFFWVINFWQHISHLTVQIFLPTCPRLYVTSSNFNDFYALFTQAIESRTLALARSLTQQLQTTCLVVVSSVQGLPNHIQQEALSLSRSASQMYVNFRVSSQLSGSRIQLGQMKESLDHVMDYLVNNTPLNWLVGPFYPRMAPKGIRTLGPAPQPHPNRPSETEMEELCQEQQSWPVTASCSDLFPVYLHLFNWHLLSDAFKCKTNRINLKCDISFIPVSKIDKLAEKMVSGFFVFLKWKQ